MKPKMLEIRPLSIDREMAVQSGGMQGHYHGGIITLAILEVTLCLPRIMAPLEALKDLLFLQIKKTEEML